MSELNKLKVWDPLVRVFHWTLVLAFFVAFITEEDFLDIHVFAGYLILLLLVIRVVWGFVGTHYARFSEFVYRPTVVMQFVKDTLALKAKRYIGHNPAGGAMIIALMVSLVITGFTGLLVYAAAEHAGPLVGWFTSKGGFWAEAWEEVHEFFANFTMFLVVVHVIGVLLESLVHGENLVTAMITGFKSRHSRSD
ncbi:MAG: cytochrome b/b6 domain-containing protein [Gammaproteobacteria bacterium]|nr:cytochrome b/b6 domain-containing protein [Gammaproteobacteria bacterium]